ncbi:MAG: hypothetical protein K9H49_16755 [Bacteroidales bacterium]|nr:hypothetical protein [Bacteroidales bacterium]
MLILQSLSKEINSKTFEFSYTYDWFGRPYSKTYPSVFSVSYDYNDYGDLKSIKSGGLKVW